MAVSSESPEPPEFLSYRMSMLQAAVDSPGTGIRTEAKKVNFHVGFLQSSGLVLGAA